MFILFRYILGNLRQRWVATSLTAFSFAIVSAILMTMLSMVEGIKKTVMPEGNEDRFMIVGKSAMSENQSVLEESDPSIIGAFPEVKEDANGRPYTSLETVTTSKLKNQEGGLFPQVIRGVDLERARVVHDQIRIVEGRYFAANALDELIIGKGIAQMLRLKAGDKLELRRKPWKVVGVFSNNRSPSESEIWISRENMEMDFHKDFVSSVWGKVADKDQAAYFVEKLNKDNRVQVFAHTEREYFSQGASTAKIYQAIGWFVASFLSIGAVFGAMNTMYASLGGRIREFSTLRAIGFTKPVIFQATVFESVLIALFGGLVAALLTFVIDGFPLSVNMAGIGKVMYEIETTTLIRLIGIAFSVALGFLSGLLPARTSIQIGIVQGFKS